MMTFPSFFVTFTSGIVKPKLTRQVEDTTVVVQLRLPVMSRA